MDPREIRTGEQTKVGARVDEGVYNEFLSWVKETTGRHYAEVGDALTRAMLEYMDDERVADDVKEIKDRTKQNEALLRQLRSELEKKEREKRISTTDPVPQGKDPGSRKKREVLVTKAVAKNGDVISLDGLKDAIKHVAEVSSTQTVKDYVESITATAALKPISRANHWRVDRDAVVELCEEHGVVTADLTPGADTRSAADD